MRASYGLLAIISLCVISLSMGKTENKEAHKLTIIGVNNKSILKAINEQVDTATTHLTEIERTFWVKRNINNLYKVLYTFGYFDAKVTPANSNTVEEFKIELNTRYTIQGAICLYKGQVTPQVSKLSTNNLFALTGLEKGSFFLGKKVSSSINKIKNFYTNLGFAFVQVEISDISLDRTNKTAEIIYAINLDKVIKIRNTIINIKSKKSPKLLEQFIRNRITWKTGEYYDPKKINYFQDDLVKYDLFASSNVSLSNPIQDNKNPEYVYSDIIVDLEEAPLRSVQAGGQLSTSRIFNILAGWKHYNIDGKGSTLEMLGNIAKDEQTIKVEHNYYDLLVRRQKLSTQAKFTREDETSYNLLKYGLNSMLWQSAGRFFEWGIGGLVETSKTIDKVVTDDKLINSNVDYVQTFGIPIGIKFDLTDNNLDPHRGIRADASVTPLFSKKTNYSRFLGALYGYFNIGKNYTNYGIVCVPYIRYGKMFGNTELITRDKMFFAGGANSVRGYGEKKIGPLLNRIPYGGLSLMELGLECRFRFNDTIGATFFIESGTVYNQNKPQNWLAGWGIGFRYYTMIGPIRLDIAFPTKRRKDHKNKYIDSLFNIYIGIGQAF